MEELIKEAEKLYENLYKLQRKLPLSIYDNDTLIKIKCLLKVIIDRKDNIVDLGEVWHDITEPTERNGYVLLYKHPKFIEKAIQGQKIWGESICKGAKYAYLKDLLPKGGEA